MASHVETSVLRSKPLTPISFPISTQLLLPKRQIAAPLTTTPSVVVAFPY